MGHRVNMQSARHPSSYQDSLGIAGASVYVISGHTRAAIVLHNSSNESLDTPFDGLDVILRVSVEVTLGDITVCVDVEFVVERLASLVAVTVGLIWSNLPKELIEMIVDSKVTIVKGLCHADDLTENRALDTPSPLGAHFVIGIDINEQASKSVNAALESCADVGTLEKSCRLNSEASALLAGSKLELAARRFDGSRFVPFEPVKSPAVVLETRAEVCQNR